MIPTEHEYTVATHAAAKAAHDRVAAEREKRDGRPYLKWDDETVAGKRLWLEEVLPIVDAAISAIPDRAEEPNRRLQMLRDLWAGDPGSGGGAWLSHSMMALHQIRDEIMEVVDGKRF